MKVTGLMILCLKAATKVGTKEMGDVIAKKINSSKISKRISVMTQVQIYDTTLRDGAQREGISFSVVDKIHIVQKLDELGIHYIEGGWPGSNPKDAEFFSQARNLRLANAKIVAFGSTRRPNTKAETDANLLALVDSGMKIVTLVGKNSILQVTQVLETTPEENLKYDFRFHPLSPSKRDSSLF